MAARRGGSSTPSYKGAVAGRDKTHLSNVRGIGEEENRSKEKETDGEKSNEKGNTKDKEEEDKNQGGKKEDVNQKGSCRPRANISPRVVLNNPALQEHREHMETYAIICKFMGVWPTEKALQTWIKYH